jgi:hypothetical protein
MSGATTLLPFYAFMAWTGKSLTFTDFGYYGAWNNYGENYSVNVKVY